MITLEWLELACEQIDASVFSGDLLWLEKDREMLKQYAERWKRAIEQHESMMLRDINAAAENKF